MSPTLGLTSANIAPPSTIGDMRSYGDACAIARALDLIGERWAMLIARELVFGPKRFTDLRAGLPQASPNVLAQRLRELDEAGVLQKRKLGPPVGAMVYELTPWGQQLQPILVQLGQWGRQAPPPEPTATMSPDALMLAIESHFNENAAANGFVATCAVHLGDDTYTLRIDNGLDITRGSPPNPDLRVDTDVSTLRAVVMKRQTPEQARRTGRFEVAGDQHVLDTLVTGLG